MARLLLGLLLVWILVPAAADAQRRGAPPGNSGVDEYLEVVPGGGGGRPSKQLREPSHPRLNLRARRNLSAQGPTGVAAARLAQKTSVAPRRPGSPTPAPGETEGSHPAVALRDAVVGSGPGGMGVALPAILIAVTLAAVGAGVVRRRA
jgi:hypothetical protein